MRILVTGGTGFTGSHLVKRLLARGHNVDVLDNQKGIFYNELINLGAKIYIGEITDRSIVDRLTSNCGAVFHIAAAFRGVNLPKKIYWNVNVEGTRIMCDSSLRNGAKRFIYCSTEGVHGRIPNPPADENAPIAPKDYYQFSKYKGEGVVQEYIKKGLKAVIIRPTAIYGPGDPGRFLLLFRWAKKGVFLMFGSGKITYHPVYIDNLSDAFELAMEKESALGQTYLIADDRYYSLNELVKKVGDSIGVNVKITHLPFFPLLISSYICEWLCMPFGITPPLFVRRADWYRENRGFSIEKAKRELGYIPKIDIDTGLRITGEWYKEHSYI